MLTEKEFYFVRHGQTDWNLERRIQGQTDIPLNAVGRRQAELAAQVASDLRFGTICTSPLSRAVDTAKTIQRTAGGRLEVLDDLAECNWGKMEGEIRGAWYEQWKRGAAIPEGAETYRAFLQRALNAINKALAFPGPVLIVAHGGVYWAVQVHALRELAESLPNAEIVLHTPPSTAHPWWSATMLKAQIGARKYSKPQLPIIEKA